MELPKSGNTVIIDDKVNEALPLMNVLAMQGISYCYFNGEPNNYPNEPLDSVRLIFVDMHLDEVASATNGSKNVISTLLAGIEKIIGEDNGPYAILVWSKHDSEYMNEFRKVVLKEGVLPSKPIAVLNMEKAECFERSEEVDGQLIWKIKKKGLEKIEQTIVEQMETVDAFILLYNWENGIKRAANEIVCRISNINENDEWNRNIKGDFLKIANAYAGKVLEKTNSEITKNLYYAMNEMVNDTNCVIAEKIVENISEINVFQSQNEIKGNIQMVKKIGDKKYIISYDESGIYHLYENNKEKCEGKHIDKIFNNVENDAEELQDFYLRKIANVNSMLLIRHYFLEDMRPGNVYLATDELKEELCELVDSKEDYNKVKGIEVEISPICDYSQKKRKRVRMLPGLIVPREVKIKDSANYLYVTKTVLIENKITRLIFDFRYFKSEQLEYLTGKKVEFAIGDILLQNIKDELTNHISRSGIVVVE